WQQHSNWPQLTF
nr:immunoglobulin light chain junction region [Macaca mulatta]MPN91445.1 immunoglobulin light chain junction region [Macaca mulatta]MPN91747.1 immunoglobulin light chain junction region [Macaca mulatta]MPN91947.1 immunoglobulin light chain junction region [Macaca mulatta]MPN93732.1 immunoglobulin light chain junction region [Macaca mulatta]